MRPLSKVPASDRERVRALIIDARCACDLCQALRTKLGLPLAPEAARAPKKKSAPKPKHEPEAGATEIVGRYDLATAPVYTTLDAKKLISDPAEAVALNLNGWFGRKMPAALRRALPSFPLRALGLCDQKMRALWPQVYELRDLEVLTLYHCGLVHAVTNEIAALEKLRAFDIGYNSLSAKWDPALYALPKLEIALGIPEEESPPAIASSKTLRFLDASRWQTPLPKAARDLELTGLIFGEGAFSNEDVSRMPLEFLWSRAYAPARADHLRHLVWEAPIAPPWIAELPKLSSLHLKVAQLPDWLPKLTNLDTLIIHLGGVADVAALAPLAKMTRLRVLGLFVRDESDLSFDASALTNLETLIISGGVKLWSQMPRGIATLAKLGRFIAYVSGDSEVKKMRDAVPHVTVDGNIVRIWDPLVVYGSLRPGTTAALLARFRVEWWLDLSRG